ncbi:hypothetical protein HMPREF0476_1006 [Kingella kingae ATCC 23330]|uniref:HMA domain-containing protein n=2 Tax=Kingella kingae TaxID=504 RepID=F5S723_KINKI|nr:hypothetical protein HMPREF0476_1006 [Kingella kingae ATCC 23330]
MQSILVQHSGSEAMPCRITFYCLMKELFMAQSKFTVGGMGGKADADRLVEQTSSVAGVKFVNANHEGGYVVVTHGDDFDEAAFKAAVGAAGFSV